MGRSVLIIATILALTSSASAVASSPVQKDQEEIEIIGKAPPEIRREATEYVHQLGVVHGEQPIARWLDGICPHAIGLDPNQSAAVEQQVRSLATSIGAPLAKGECSPNLLIVFTDDPKGVVRTVFRKLWLNTEFTGDRKQLEDSELPVRWWYSHEDRDKDGPQPGLLPPISISNGAFASNGANSGSLPANQGTKSLTHTNNGNVSNQVERAITHATVVIDTHIIAGKSLESLVYYAGLVGMAEIRLGATAPNSNPGHVRYGHEYGRADRDR